MTKVHLDTDLGGDIDDLCALALLLRRAFIPDLRNSGALGELLARQIATLSATAQRLGSSGAGKKRPRPSSTGQKRARKSAVELNK